ncbi:MAG: DUF2079 domain-containing protein [Candidatus Thermoplasmatota archaeon]|nr:DUF2079 domain-containing protein [Candidatus Thermoplasmatota archaeon]
MKKPNKIGDLYLFLLILSTAAVGTTYSVLSLLRFYSYHAGILDLGVAYMPMYNEFHGNLIQGYYGVILPQVFSYIIFAPFFGIFPAIPELLVFQDIWIACGAIPLYFLGKRLGLNGFATFALSLSYLLYFPLGGVYWFDFHYMSLFPTFFFLFAWAYFAERRNLAIIFAFMASMMNYLVPSMMFIAAVVIFLRDYREKKYRNLLPFTIIATSIAIYLYVNLAIGLRSETVYIGLPPVFSIPNPAIRYMYPIMLFLPLLFLSFLAPEFLLIGAPFFAFVYSSNYFPYMSLMFYQYPVLITPIVFVSAFVGASRIKRIPRLSRTLKPLVSAVLFLNVLFFAFLTPVGNVMTSPYDAQVSGLLLGTGYSYSTMEDIAIHPYDKYITNALNEIPYGSSVMLQGNMPNFLYRYNWTLPENMNNHNVPNYSVVDPYSSFYTSPSEYGSNLSNVSILQDNWLMKFHNFKVVSEQDGIVLMSDLHMKSTLPFVPLFQAIEPSSLDYPVKVTETGNLTILPAIDTGSGGWYGPYTWLVPGQYSLHLFLKSPGVSPSSWFTLQVANTSVVGHTQTVIYQHNVYGSNLSSTGISEITFSFTSQFFLSSVEFRAFYMHWDAPIYLQGITISQESI